MLFKDISYLELWQPFCSAEWNHLCNFGRGYHEEQFSKKILNLDHYEEHFCEMIFILDQWLRRCHLKTFLIYSSGGPFALW